MTERIAEQLETKGAMVRRWRWWCDKMEGGRVQPCSAVGQRTGLPRRGCRRGVHGGSMRGLAYRNCLMLSTSGPSPRFVGLGQKWRRT